MRSQAPARGERDPDYLIGSTPRSVSVGHPMVAVRASGGLAWSPWHTEIRGRQHRIANSAVMEGEQTCGSSGNCAQSTAAPDWNYCPVEQFMHQMQLCLFCASFDVDGSAGDRENDVGAEASGDSSAVDGGGVVGGDGDSFGGGVLFLDE